MYSKASTLSYSVMLCSEDPRKAYRQGSIAQYNFCFLIQIESIVIPFRNRICILFLKTRFTITSHFVLKSRA